MALKCRPQSPTRPHTLPKLWSSCGLSNSWESHIVRRTFLSSSSLHRVNTNLSPKCHNFVKWSGGSPKLQTCCQYETFLDRHSLKKSCRGNTMIRFRYIHSCFIPSAISIRLTMLSVHWDLWMICIEKIRSETKCCLLIKIQNFTSVLCRC